MNILLVEVQRLCYGDVQLSFLHNFLKSQSYSVNKCYLDEFIAFIGNSFNYDYIIFMTSEQKGEFSCINDLIKIVRGKSPSTRFIISGAAATWCHGHVSSLTDGDLIIKGCLVPKIKEFIENKASCTGSNYIDIGKDYDISMLEIDVDAYPYNDNGIYSVLQSIGCNYAKCSFCPLKFMYDGIKVRPVENIIRDMKELDKKRNAKVFLFRDQNFLINNKRFDDLCTKMNNENLNQKMQFCARADSIINCLPAILKYPQKISRIAIGIESFLETQLIRYNKGITAEKGFLALDSMVKLGVKTKYFLIIADNQTDLNELLQISDVFRTKPEYIIMLASARLREYFEYDNEQADYQDCVKIYHKAIEGIVEFNNLTSEGINTYNLFFRFKMFPDSKRKYISDWFDKLDKLVTRVKDQKINYSDALSETEDCIHKMCGYLGDLYA